MYSRSRGWEVVLSPVLFPVAVPGFCLWMILVTPAQSVHQHAKGTGEGHHSPHLDYLRQSQNN